MVLAQQSEAHFVYRMRVCTWFKYRFHWSLVQKDTHPHMCHPPSLLFPHGHFDVRFPSSPAPPPAMTFPRSVSTPSSPRRGTPPGGPVSGSLANLTTYTGYEPNYNVDDDTEITPIIYPDTDDRILDFSTDLISDGEQTKFGSM